MLFTPSMPTNLSSLQRLETNGVSESRVLEYKEALEVTNKEQRQEFLADVSAFANTVGGTIVFGMRENDGVASKFCGFYVDNQDDFILSLQNLLRDGLQPSLTRCKFEFVALQPRNFVLLAHIPRSPLAPHRVTLGGRSHFYRRGDRSKYLLDTDQLRLAFFDKDSEERSTRDFIFQRIGMLNADETPVRLSSGPKLICHLIHAEGLVDQTDRMTFVELPNVPPLGASGWSSLSCYEGIATYTGPEFADAPCQAYTLVFMNGIVESVANIGFSNDGVWIPIGTFDRCLGEILDRQLISMTDKGFTYPFDVHITLVGCRDAKLMMKNTVFQESSPYGLRREIVQFGVMRIENLDADTKCLKSKFIEDVVRTFGMAAR